jgi:hypothetical protein
MVPFNVSILSNFGAAAMSTDWASAAICANASRCYEPRALDQMQRRLGAGAIE